jgi:hypothetical protein
MQRFEGRSKLGELPGANGEKFLFSIRSNRLQKLNTITSFHDLASGF